MKAKFKIKELATLLLEELQKIQITEYDLYYCERQIIYKWGKIGEYTKESVTKEMIIEESKNALKRKEFLKTHFWAYNKWNER